MTPTTPDTAAAPTQRAWFDLVPENGTPEGTVAQMAAYAIAHGRAHSDRLRVIFNTYDIDDSHRSQELDDAIRATNRHNLWPYTAAFTAAALARGWTTQDAADVLANDAEACDDLLYEWANEAGIDPDSVASADDVITTGYGVSGAEWARLRGVEKQQVPA